MILGWFFGSLPTVAYSELFEAGEPERSLVPVFFFFSSGGVVGRPHNYNDIITTVAANRTHAQ